MSIPRLTLRQRIAELSSRPVVARAFFAAALALIGVLHLTRNAFELNHREVWLDEASTYLVAQYPIGRVLTLPIEFHSQPPFYYVLLHYASLVSSSEVFIRGLSWLFCLLLVAFVMLDLNELRIPSRVGFCVLFVCNEFTLFLSRELRPYALSALSSFVASVLLLRFVGRPDDRRLAVLYVASAFVMAYTLAFDVWPLVAHGLFVAGAIGISLAWRGARETARTLWPVAAALVLLALLYLPYVRHVLAHEPPSATAHPPGLRAVVDVALDKEHFLSAMGKYAGVPAPYSYLVWALAAFGVVCSLRKAGGSGALWCLILFGQIAFAYGFLLGKLPVSHRYLTPAFPAFLMCVALGFDQLISVRPARLWLVVLVMLGLMVRESYGPFAAFLKAPVPAENWRRLYAELRKIPGKKGLFFDTGGYAQMLEYVARNDRDFTFFTDGFDPIPGTGLSAGGEPMSRAYVERMVTESAAQTPCFFYARDRRRSSKERDRERGVYDVVFLPAMQRLGYTQTFSSQSPDQLKDAYHDFYLMTGFCRP